MNGRLARTFGGALVAFALSFGVVGCIAQPAESDENVDQGGGALTLEPVASTPGDTGIGASAGDLADEGEGAPIEPSIRLDPDPNPWKPTSSPVDPSKNK